MYVYVNEARCKGCGACVKVCPHDAVVLDGGVAHIDTEACDACGACIEVCPEGAILSVSEPADVQTVPVVRASRPSVPTRREGHVPALVAVGRKLAPWAGAALAFVGREIAPRVVSSLLRAWDAHLAGRAPDGETRESRDAIASRPMSQFTSPGRHRARQRHGRSEAGRN